MKNVLTELAKVLLPVDDKLAFVKLEYKQLMAVSRMKSLFPFIS